jgi:serine O-acetyltransferase
VGDDARIGSNAVVVNDVPEGATMVGVPAHAIEGRERRNKNPDGTCGDFSPYAIPKRGIKDPVECQLAVVIAHMESLQKRLDTLEREQQSADTANCWESKQKKATGQ